MFRRTRERLDRIERAIEELLKRDTAPPAGAPSGDSLTNLLGSMMKNNVDLVGAMGDLAVRSVARRNGIRGGTSNARTAQRDRDGKFLPKNRRERRAAGPVCPLCRYGESFPGVTIDMVNAHRAHRERAMQYGAAQEGENGQSDESDQPDESDGSGGYRNGSTPEPGN